MGLFSKFKKKDNRRRKIITMFSDRWNTYFHGIPDISVIREIKVY